jgi:hypothetical protein
MWFDGKTECELLLTSFLFIVKSSFPGREKMLVTIMSYRPFLTSISFLSSVKKEEEEK